MESLQESISKIEILQKLGFVSKSRIHFKNDSNALITLYYDWIDDLLWFYVEIPHESMKFPYSQFMTCDVGELIKEG